MKYYREVGTCSNVECTNPVENHDTGLCASCGARERKLAKAKMPDDKEPIAKQSVKMSRLMSIYIRKKKSWIRGKKCVVLKNAPATDVHHVAGRSPDAYYDEWAEQNGIPLLLDERFWLPVSREGHTEIELRPAWAKQMGFSESRLTIKE